MRETGVGVRIAGSVEDRLFVTSGVDAADGRTVEGLVYRPGAIVPKRGWRAVTASEWAQLMGRAPDGGTLDVAPAPAELVAAFRALGLAEGRTVGDCHALVRSEAYVDALHQALPLLEPLVVSDEGLQLLGTCVQRGGLWSTTTHVDADVGERFSGLHVDDWDRLEPGERHLGRLQMSINLGVRDRFFVFVATTVDELAGGTDRDLGYIGWGRALFAQAPETPIWKVRVRPGELYLAPTDNLIHDGTTVGNDAPDVTLNLRGHFRVAGARADAFAAVGS